MSEPVKLGTLLIFRKSAISPDERGSGEHLSIPKFTQEEKKGASYYKLETKCRAELFTQSSGVDSLSLCPLVVEFVTTTSFI